MRARLLTPFLIFVYILLFMSSCTVEGLPGLDPLCRPPPHPLPIAFGWEVSDHGRQMRGKEILLELVESEKMGFQPIFLYSKYSVFPRETNNG